MQSCNSSHQQQFNQLLGEFIQEGISYGLKSSQFDQTGELKKLFPVMKELQRHLEQKYQNDAQEPLDVSLFFLTLKTLASGFGGSLKMGFSMHGSSKSIEVLDKAFQQTKNHYREVFQQSPHVFESMVRDMEEKLRHKQCLYPFPETTEKMIEYSEEIGIESPPHPSLVQPKTSQM